MTSLTIRGNALQLPIADNTVDAVICSPPYFALRSYQDDGQHYAGQIGSEPTPIDWLNAMWACTREMRRVLKPEGSIFVNLGDRYAGAPPGPQGATGQRADRRTANEPHQAAAIQRRSDVPAKSLMLLPEAFRLGCNGMLAALGGPDPMHGQPLIARAVIVWDKPNSLPECLDPGTPLFIRQAGWVSRIPIDALVGMDPLPEVLGPEGWVQVRKVWETIKPAIYFHASKVERIICSPDHRFPVSSERRTKRIRHVPAAKIRHEGYADYLLYCPVDKFLTSTLTHYAGWPLDSNAGYLVGVYAAEGGVNGEHGTGIKLTIGAHEDSFAQRIRDALKACEVTAREGLGKGSRMFEFNDSRIVRLINAFVSGSVKRKALNIELILNSPRKFRQAVLDGYVDGDGSPRHGGGWIAASASIQLRDDVSTLASSVGVITSKGMRSGYDKRTDKTYTSHTIWTPYITHRKTKSGMDGVYQVPPRARRDAKGGPRRMIDIEVDGALFLIGDGLITHNSVQDRVRRNHEDWIHLVKQPRYYAAVDEIREPHAPKTLTHRGGGQSWGNEANPDNNWRDPKARKVDPLGKLPGSVWTIPTEPFTAPDTSPHDGQPLPQHYAAYPIEIVKRLILGWTPSGICVECGQGRRPAVNMLPAQTKQWVEAQCAGRSWHGDGGNPTRTLGVPAADRARTITGYTCACPTPDAPTQPAIILDPFAGTGTTTLVASALGRVGIGIDLSHDYARLAYWRSHDPAQIAKVLDLPKPPTQTIGQLDMLDMP